MCKCVVVGEWVVVSVGGEGKCSRPKPPAQWQLKGFRLGAQPRYCREQQEATLSAGLPSGDVDVADP